IQVWCGTTMHRIGFAIPSDGRQPRILLRVSPRRNAFRDLRAPQTAERYPLLVMARLTRILFRPPVSYSVPSVISERNTSDFAVDPVRIGRQHVESQLLHDLQRLRIQGGEPEPRMSVSDLRTPNRPRYMQAALGQRKSTRY